ncbi:MAG: zinc-binding dehydrogenase [Ktedonobacteraceae bacterium]
MSSIRAVVVDPNVPGRLALLEVATPVPSPSEALVRVSAISLNLGEVRRATTVAEADWRPGWDFAGMVEQAAADSSGPRKGTRVVGLLSEGSWAEVVAAPTNTLGRVHEGVTFAQAATLPVAGLTALRALEKGGLLLNKKVLITGASGGVGHFACQLAHHAGAYVVGVVRRPERVQAVQELGADLVVVGDDLSKAREHGPYDLILESVGGKSLADALSMLAQDSICVNFGVSSGNDITFDARQFFATGGASLYGFILFHELTHRPAGGDLTNLTHMIADGHLHPQIEVEESWTKIADVAQQLVNRRITGKAVLRVS